MSIESKAVLMNRIEQRLSSLITADEMNSVMEVVADQIGAFDIEQVETEEHGSDDLLSAYLSSLEVEGKSPKTIERYKRMLNRLMQIVKVDTRSVTVYHLRKYLADEKARGIADRTLEGDRSVICTYFNWLQRENLIKQNPAANLAPIKYPKRIKQAYSEVDIEKLKRYAGSSRNLAIICFLYSTGCRITEVTQLNRDSVDLAGMECTVIGKGNKERTVYLDPVAAMTLEEYLKNRTDNSEALFAGKGSPRLTQGGVRYMLKTVEEKSGVDHVYPHKFRRTRATNLIRHGMPIQEVAAILGHEKLDTTMKYVVLDKRDIKNSYRKYA